MIPIVPRITRFAGLALAAALQLNIYTQAQQLPAAPAPETPKASETSKTPETPKGPGPVHIVPGYCGPTNIRVFRFVNATNIQEQNDILTVIRNVTSPVIRVTISPFQNALVAEGTESQLGDIQKLLDELDKPKRLFRLTYTLIELDGTKRLGDQHYSMVVVPGQRTVLKQGNKIPVATATDFKNVVGSQVTYLDLGMNFDATLDDAPNVLRLRSKVEQSSVIEDRAGATAAQDPVIRQSVFEGSAMLAPGKPLTIGTLDHAGTTRRYEIQVTVEPIKP